MWVIFLLSLTLIALSSLYCDCFLTQPHLSRRFETIMVSSGGTYNVWPALTLYLHYKFERAGDPVCFSVMLGCFSHFLSKMVAMRRPHDVLTQVKPTWCSTSTFVGCGSHKSLPSAAVLISWPKISHGSTLNFCFYFFLF